jgi:hypothetical protein
VKTSLASPWITVLGTLAETSQPIAYGTAGLIGLQRLLAMLMQWQRHRVTIEWQRHQVTMDRDVAQLRKMLEEHASGIGVRAEVVAAAARLGTVTEAEMIEPGDPRARA